MMNRRREGDAVSLLGTDALTYDGRAWGETSLAPHADLAGEWRDLLSGSAMRIGDGADPAVSTMLARLPVAVFLRA